MLLLEASTAFMLQFVSTNGSVNVLDMPVDVPPPVPLMPPPEDIDTEGPDESNLDRSRWSSCTDSSGKLCLIVFTRLGMVT